MGSGKQFETSNIQHRTPNIQCETGQGLALLIGFGGGFEGFDEDFAEDVAGSQMREGVGGAVEGKDGVNDGFQAAFGGPFEGHEDVGAVAAVAADEALLLHEKGPEVEGDLATGGGAAGDDHAVAGEAVEDLLEDIAADVLDDEVGAVFGGEAADFGGPVGRGGVHHEVGAELAAEFALGFGGAGADDASAEVFGDLDGRGADAAGCAHDEDPLAGADLGAVGEHVHGGAAGKGEGGGGVKVNAVRKAHEGAFGDEDFFGEAAVALDAEEFAAKAEGFVALAAEFAFAAEEIGLDGDGVGGFPIGDAGADLEDFAGDFAAGSARQGDFEREFAGLEPEVEMVEAAGLDLDDDFAGGGRGVGDVAEFEFARRAVGCELDRFHGAIEHRRLEIRNTQRHTGFCVGKLLCLRLQKFSERRNFPLCNQARNGRIDYGAHSYEQMQWLQIHRLCRGLPRGLLLRTGRAGGHSAGRLH